MSISTSPTRCQFQFLLAVCNETVEGFTQATEKACVNRGWVTTCPVKLTYILTPEGLDLLQARYA